MSDFWLGLLIGIPSGVVLMWIVLVWSWSF